MIFVVAVVIALLAFLLFVGYFRRNPEREIPKGDNLVSPADGKVVSIIPLSNRKIKVRKGLLGKVRTWTNSKKGFVISIFMNPFDVHVNRAPCSGKVSMVRHVKGRLLSLTNFENSFENEHNEIVLESKHGEIKTIQIAGFLARRIRCFVRKGQTVNKGQRIGMIDLGSQVTVVVPKAFTPCVNVGDRVKAGSSVLAVKK